MQSLLSDSGASGTLVFAVMDPQPSLPPKAQNKDHKITPTAVPAKGQANGPQTVAALTMTITKVEVHLASNEAKVSVTPNVSPAEPEDHWQTLTITTPFTVDLVKLAATNSISMLGITTLPAGKYTQVRLFLSSATATLADGTVVNLDILGPDNMVKVIQPFTVVAGQKTTLIMDFDAQHSVVKADNKYILKPVVAKLLEQH